METKSPQNKKEENKKSSNTGLIVVLVISILSNIGLGFGFYSFMNKSNEQETEIAALNSEVIIKDAEVLSKTHDLENLQMDLERIKEERERLGLSNDSLELQMTELAATISKLRRTAKLDAGVKAQLEKLIADLRGQVVEKEMQIAVLTIERDSLNTSLASANEDKMRLGDSLNSTASALAYAAVLKAENFKVLGVRENGKEFEGAELKGSRIDRLKVVFSLADNKAAKRDDKDIFVALTTPAGEVFSDPNNGGGLITLEDGSDALYTMNQNVKFDNTNQQMAFTMLKGFSYVPGQYKLTVYSEGHVIGKGGFKVK
jgi:hypothetical protein